MQRSSCAAERARVLPVRWRMKRQRVYVGVEGEGGGGGGQKTAHVRMNRLSELVRQRVLRLAVM